MNIGGAYMKKMPQWLKKAVFYEIYPQSFCDTNGDGIGDIEGIIEKLDYIRSLGCNALWINPWYDSPFKDAGYDVRDFKKIAPRYGTNEDARHLFEEAHRKGIHVLLDLVAGHTSEEHAWFRQSQRAVKNAYTDRYIWTDFCFENGDGIPYVAGESERSAAYLLNFYKCQPALNYGFLHPDRPWQQPMDAPGPKATVEALEDIMRFWLEMGCDGFRVDMASSLVKKDDETKSGTRAIWEQINGKLSRDYPEAAMVSEWSDPRLALKCGFHMDFYLNKMGNGYCALMRDYWNDAIRRVGGGERALVPEGAAFTGALEDALQPGSTGDHSYFRKDTDSDITRFTEDYLPKYEASKDDGLFCFLTCNHDTPRPSWNLGPDELKIAYAVLFTLPGAPYLYYGDEIGMRYRRVPTKEGGYFRTGARTPMQWSGGKNLGFSAAQEKDLYLPVDPAPDAVTVEGEEDDPDSLLTFVSKLLKFRGSREELNSDAPFEVVYARPDSPVFAYRRGRLLLAVNPKTAAHTVPVPSAGKVVFQTGEADGSAQALTMGPQSFVVIQM